MNENNNINKEVFFFRKGDSFITAENTPKIIGFISMRVVNKKGNPRYVFSNDIDFINNKLFSVGEITKTPKELEDYISKKGERFVVVNERKGNFLVRDLIIKEIAKRVGFVTKESIEYVVLNDSDLRIANYSNVLTAYCKYFLTKKNIPYEQTFETETMEIVSCACKESSVYKDYENDLYEKNLVVNKDKFFAELKKSLTGIDDNNLSKQCLSNLFFGGISSVSNNKEIQRKKYLYLLKIKNVDKMFN